ncbi:hypothetical protein ACU42Y_09950 [Proteus mirabilis]
MQWKTGYGSAVPRIGTQVLVSYLNWDIDRPIITGCTYDGRNAPPISSQRIRHKPLSVAKPTKGKVL